MQSPGLRRAILLTLTLSLVMRVGFLAFGEVLPVTWDARRYAAAALGLISLVDDSGPEAMTDERDDRYRFKHYYEKYVQGEQINWLSYTPHTLTQAREEVFISGPLYPLLLAAIFTIAPEADFTFARILGILFDLGANLLLILVGIRLVGRLPALLAGLAYAVYFPFVLSSSMILLDTSTNFWILLTLYLLLRAVETGRPASMMWAGVVTGLLVLNKPTATLLAGPLIAGLYFYARSTWPTPVFMKRLLWYVAPLGAIAAVWVTIASVHYGQLAIRDPEYAAANLRHSSSIMFEGYDLDKVGEEAEVRLETENVLADPLGYAGLVVKKLDRMWRRPYNDFRRSLVWPYQVDEMFHLFIVVIGLAGLLLLSRVDFKLAAWLLFIIGYYTLIHVVFHSTSRYNLNAMPMMLLAASYLIALAWRSRRLNVSLYWGRLLAVAILLAAAWWFGPDGINALIGSGVNDVLVLACLLVKTLLLAAGLWFMGRMLVYEGRPRGRLLMTIGTVVVISLTGWTMTLDRDRWTEFECKVTDAGAIAGTRIYMDELPILEDGETFGAVVDINTGYGPKTAFVIKVGEWSQGLTWEDERVGNLFYPKPTYRYYSQLLPLGTEAFRQYLIIPVHDSLLRRELDQRGYIDIRVSLASDDSASGLSLWGKHEIEGEEHYLPAIRFTKSDFTSVERFIHEGDPRIGIPVKYLSDSAVSYYIRSDEPSSESKVDLSPQPGIQAGRYNMFLVHLARDGDFWVY